MRYPDDEHDAVVDVLEPLEDAAPAEDAARPVRKPQEVHPKPRRSTPRPRVIRLYQRWRAASSIALVALFFLGVWLLNGYFTVQAARGLGLSIGVGWAIHLLFSIIELTTVVATPHLQAVRAPGWVYLVLWAIVLPFGVLDTLTSALGLLQWGLALNLPFGLPLQGSATIAALILAFLPEPMVLWLSAALGSALRRR